MSGAQDRKKGVDRNKKYSREAKSHSGVKKKTEKRLDMEQSFFNYLTANSIGMEENKTTGYEAYVLEVLHG